MNNPEFSIAGRKVGLNYDPLIIAEIGINHGGSLATAFEMVDAAFAAGVEVVKHQTHVVEDEMSHVARTVVPGNSTSSIYEIMASCALSEEDELKLKNYIESKGMIFLSTPFSRAAADRLNRFGVAAYKIGSGECNNYPLIEHIAGFGKPVILSTGMNTIQTIRPAVAILEKLQIPYALLHTTNLYPTPPRLVRLGAMQELAKSFPNAVVGLSDHTTDNLACLGAVALGASILERHFTDRMDRQGPDIVCSMDRSACEELIHGSRILKLERGGDKAPAKEEAVTMNFAFATVVAIKPIEAGETLSLDNIWVKRPGTGEIPAANFNSLLGMRAVRAIHEDAHLQFADVGVQSSAARASTTLKVERIVHKAFDMRSLKRDVNWKLDIASKQKELAGAVQESQRELHSCPICDSNSSDLFVVIYEFPFHECHDCGHIFSKRPPDPQSISKLYGVGEDKSNKSSQNDIYIRKDLFEIRIRDVAGPKVRFVTERVPLQGSWVDIGAGVGDLVIAAQNLGWKARGLECDPAQVEFAREYGIDLLQAYVTPENASKLLADARVVSLINFLEHQLNPTSFLQMIQQAVTKSAYVLLEVPRHPSLSSLANKAFPSLAARHIYPPDHLHIFTDKSLQHMLDRSGLKAVSIWTFGQDAYELLSSAFALAGSNNPEFHERIMGLAAVFQKNVDDCELSDTMLVLASVK
jgi:sialic acid synthase SpsE